MSKQNSKTTTIYEEKLFDGNEGTEYIYIQGVHVWLEKIETPRETIYVLRSLAWVDDETVVDSYQVFSWTSNKNKLLRKAIEKFDELLAAHPTLAEAERRLSQQDDEAAQ